MNYNHFTINYIELLKKHLKIELFDNRALFFPDRVTIEDISLLKEELSNIWESSSTAIRILEESYDSKIQSGLFGLIDDFELALKTGYLIGDRVVALDFIYERILKNKKENQVNKLLLGKASANLVLALELAKKGRFVIIPSPFYWNSDSKKIIKKVAKKTLVSPELMSLLNLLSITKSCNLKPYTIAESDESFKRIINKDIDSTSLVGKDGEYTAYEAILAGLLSERLLNEEEFKLNDNISLIKYHNIINQEEKFYKEYISAITAGGSMYGDRNIEEIKVKLQKDINKKNKRLIKSTIKTASNIGGVGGATIALLSTIIAVSSPLVVVGGLLSLAPALTALIKDDNENKNSIITVFSNLKN